MPEVFLAASPLVASAYVRRGVGLRPTPKIPAAREKNLWYPGYNLLDGLSEPEVKSRYRFSRDSIQYITDTLAPDLERPTERNHALKPQEQVLVALRFFASGSFLELVGDTVGGIPKCTVSRIVSRVSTALARKQNQFIRWPSTAAERQEIKQGFFEKGGFPGVIGCIDGTHIRIQGPSAHESDFVNRKGFHSINVQAICDHRGKDPGLLNC